MELIRGLHNLRPVYRGCVATIGAFDGVHLGHQRVIGHLLEQARALDLPSVVIVFEPLPREFLCPAEAPPRLMSFREKFAALAALGVDRVLRIRFDAALQVRTARDFVDDVFVAGLGVRYLVLGDDFRFGRDREGDAGFIREQGLRHGYQTVSTPTVAFDGERISSTRVRQALAAADFELAAALLGRPYAMSGKVVFGRQLGRTLDFPTANLALHRLRSPLTGVFAVEVDGAGLEGAFGVANVGTRPTLEDGLRANLEVHLLDRHCDLYGKHIRVTFRHKLREEQKFDSVALLRDQIGRDAAAARAWLAAQACNETG